MVVCSHVYPSPLKELIQNFKTNFLGSACVRAKIANEHERTLAAFLLYLGRFLPLLLFMKDFPMLVLCGSRKTKQTEGYLCFRDLIGSTSKQVSRPPHRHWVLVKCS